MKTRATLKAIYINVCGWSEEEADSAIRCFFATDIEEEIEFYKNWK